MNERVFGWEALREQSAIGLTSLAREAAHYYLADRESERAGWRCPRFHSAVDGYEWPTLGGLPPTVAEELRAALAHEADRQGVEPGRLLRHAHLYYLADLDSGRAARRILDELG